MATSTFSMVVFIFSMVIFLSSSFSTWMVLPPPRRESRIGLQKEGSKGPKGSVVARDLANNIRQLFSFSWLKSSQAVGNFVALHGSQLPFHLGVQIEQKYNVGDKVA